MFSINLSLISIIYLFASASGYNFYEKNYSLYSQNGKSNRLKTSPNNSNRALNPQLYDIPDLIRNNSARVDSSFLEIYPLSTRPFVSITEFDNNLLLVDNSGGLFVWSISENRLLNKNQFYGEIHLVHYHERSGNFLMNFYNFNDDTWRLLVVNKEFSILESHTIIEPISSIAEFNEKILLGNTDGKIIEFKLTSKGIGQLDTFSYKLNSNVQKIIQIGSDSVAIFLFSGEIGVFRKSSSENWIRIQTILPSDPNNYCYNVEFQGGLFLVRRTKGYELRNLDLKRIEVEFPKRGTTKFYGDGRIISFSGSGELILYSYLYKGLFSIREDYTWKLSEFAELHPKEYYNVSKYIISKHSHNNGSDSIIWKRNDVIAYAISEEYVALGYIEGEFELFGINMTHSERFEIEKGRVPISIAIPDLRKAKNMVLLSTVDNCIFGYYYPSGIEYLASYQYANASPLIHDVKTNTFASLRQRSLGIDFHSSRFDQVDNKVPLTVYFKTDAVMSSVNRNAKTILVLTEDSLLYLFDYKQKRIVGEIKLHSSIREIIPIGDGYLFLAADGKLFSLFGIQLSLVDFGVTDISLTEKINHACIITKDSQLIFINFDQKKRVKRSSGIPAPNLTGKNLLHLTYSNYKRDLNFIVREQELHENVSNDYNDSLNDALFLGENHIVYVDMIGNLIFVKVISDRK